MPMNKTELQQVLYQINSNQVSELILTARNINSKQATSIASALKKNQSLTSLNLQNNQVQDEGAIALASALEKNQSLTNLDLVCNQIGAKGGKAIASALKKNQNLISLILWDNEIKNKGAKAIASALKKNQSLTSLNLGCNNIGVEGAIAIAIALEKNQSLTDLSLATNYLLYKVPKDDYLGYDQLYQDLEGAKTISVALEKNHSLTSLDLTGNQVSEDEGAITIAIAAFLEKSKSLTRLYLGYNGIEDEEVKTIMAALEKNHSLTSLNLEQNAIHDEGAIAIATALKKNQSLTDLNLDYNQIGPNGVSIIIKSIFHHIPQIDISFGSYNTVDSLNPAINLKAQAKDEINRRYAFLMGTHIRLGADSLVKFLPNDVITVIFKQLQESNLNKNIENFCNQFNQEFNDNLKSDNLLKILFANLSPKVLASHSQITSTSNLPKNNSNSRPIELVSSPSTDVLNPRLESSLTKITARDAVI
jgi:Ran GTPase-activating protein (RanGAP) involved in mRNA processing and transport